MNMHAFVQCCHCDKVPRAPPLPLQEALAMPLHVFLPAVFPTVDLEVVSNQGGE